MKQIAFLTFTSKAMAIVGGAVLILAILSTGLSITGRLLTAVNLGPIPGDVEIVEIAVGLSVFLFLPWCQLKRGHATVDIIAGFLPPTLNRWFDVLVEVAMSIAVIVITHQLWQGMLTKLRNGDTTFVLQMPLSWAYGACLIAAILASLCSVLIVVERVREAVAGRSLTALEWGAGQ